MRVNEIRKTMTPDREQHSTCSAEQVWRAVERFCIWLDKNGYATYDPYDIWGTRYGKASRRFYYTKHPLGLLLTAPIIFMEMFHPSLRAWFVKKDRFATADAQLLLGFLNLHELNQEPGSAGVAKMAKSRGTNNPQLSTVWLSKAKALAEDLLNCSIPGYTGHCWGYPFDWQNVNGLKRKGTPLITATPYCFEAFVRLFDVTQETSYLEVARSAATFVFHDLNDTSTGENAAASSYTPYDTGKVVNASAYRAYVLFEAARRFGIEAYAEKAWGNLRFILQSQRSDGSWLYAIDNPAESFIDHFHTCFVLKNLYKINLTLNDTAVREAIKTGFEYYRQALFNNNGLPIMFAIQPRTQIVQLEMYNMAEAITLGVLLRNEIPGALTMACELGRRVCDEFQLKDGHFVTRVYVGGFKHTLPFLRWPQVQLLYALTNLLRAIHIRDGESYEESPIS